MHSELSSFRPLSSAFAAYLCGVTLALEGAAEIVDNDGSTAGTEEGGVGLAETTTGTGDDDDLAVVAQLASHDVCEEVRGRKRRKIKQASLVT